jgi:carboxymethylenebutenolidase
MALRDYLVGEIAEDHADGLLTRREALRRLALMGLSLTAAAAVLAACGDDDDDGTAVAPSTTTTAGSPTTTAAAASDQPTITFGGLTAAFAPAAGDLRGAVLVVHENRGLTAHFYDLVQRFADEGYTALCVDLVSEEGGSGSMPEAAVPAALADAPLERLVADLRAGIDELQRRAPGAGIGVVGFCFGGAMTWNLLDAGDDRIAAAIPFYGPAPEEPDFTGSKAAVLAVYAGLDERVNASRDRAVAALEDAGLVHEVRTFEGADHAFFNDTGARYDAAAAGEAWTAVLAWFGDHLAAT